MQNSINTLVFLVRCTIFLDMWFVTKWMIKTRIQIHADWHRMTWPIFDAVCYLNIVKPGLNRSLLSCPSYPIISHHMGRGQTTDSWPNLHFSAGEVSTRALMISASINHNNSNMHSVWLWNHHLLHVILCLTHCKSFHATTLSATSMFSHIPHYPRIIEQIVPTPPQRHYNRYGCVSKMQFPSPIFHCTRCFTSGYSGTNATLLYLSCNRLQFDMEHPPWM